MTGLSNIVVKRDCRDCGKPFERETPEILAALCVRCASCWKKHDARVLEEQREEAESNLNARWLEICPKEYQNTRLDKLPNLEAFNDAVAWKYGTEGLMLIGPTRRGKSRAAWEVVRRQFMAGRSIKILNCLTSIRYARKFADGGMAVEEWIDERTRCQVLLMDDIFKVKLTDSFEHALFSIVTMRTEMRNPIILTSNDTADSLAERLSEDRGEPMVARFREYCKTIIFK